MARQAPGSSARLSPQDFLALALPYKPAIDCTKVLGGLECVCRCTYLVVACRLHKQSYGSAGLVKAPLGWRKPGCARCAWPHTAPHRQRPQAPLGRSRYWDTERRRRCSASPGRRWVNRRVQSPAPPQRPAVPGPCAARRPGRIQTADRQTPRPPSARPGRAHAANPP